MQANVSVLNVSGDLLIQSWIMPETIARFAASLRVNIIMSVPVMVEALTPIVLSGVLSFANPGVLENVAERRAHAAWGGLPADDWRKYDVLVAPPDCEILGARGFLVVDGQTLTVLSVDCEADVHRGQMSARGLVADVNRGELVHRRGVLVLWKN